MSRENRVETLDIEPRLIRLVGRRCAAWIEARAESDKIELVSTQNYIPPQTSFHALWLLFAQEAVAAEFLELYRSIDWMAGWRSWRRTMTC